MTGRYGVDQFSSSLITISLILIVINIFVRNQILYSMGFVILIYSYFRVFSKHIHKRYQENMKYMVVHNKMMAKYNGWMEAFACRKTHKVFSCPGCGQKVRVPKGKGKVNIHCPKCNVSFIKKS